MGPIFSAANRAQDNHSVCSLDKVPLAARRQHSSQNWMYASIPYINDDMDLCVYKLSKTFDELEKHFHVTEADRNAIYQVKRIQNLPAGLKKEQPLAWVERISGFYEVLDREEKKKLSAKKLKPYSEAELKAQNIKSVYLDDDGQVKVNRFSKSKPISLNPKAK